MATKEEYRFENGEEVVEAFGQPNRYYKKNSVRARVLDEKTSYSLPWGEIVGEPGDVEIQPESGDSPYPCKANIFNETYVETSPGSGLYRKAEPSNFVRVRYEGEDLPDEIEITLKTLEGEEKVILGTGEGAVETVFIAIGIEGEVWFVSSDVVQNDFVEAQTEN